MKPITPDVQTVLQSLINNANRQLELVAELEKFCKHARETNWNLQTFCRDMLRTSSISTNDEQKVRELIQQRENVFGRAFPDMGQSAEPVPAQSPESVNSNR